MAFMSFSTDSCGIIVTSCCVFGAKIGAFGDKFESSLASVAAYLFPVCLGVGSFSFNFSAYVVSIVLVSSNVELTALTTSLQSCSLL